MERYDGFIYIIGKDRIGYTGIKWYNVDENGMRKYIYIYLGVESFPKNDAFYGMSWVENFSVTKTLILNGNSG